LFSEVIVLLERFFVDVRKLLQAVIDFVKLFDDLIVS
jgi:hypothetical protein